MCVCACVYRDAKKKKHRNQHWKRHKRDMWQASKRGPINIMREGTILSGHGDMATGSCAICVSNYVCMYVRMCVCVSSITSVFPCQYHSTIAPYSFIHLPPTLYNVFLPALQFSPDSIIPPLLHIHLHIRTLLTRKTTVENCKDSQKQYRP